MYTKWPVMIWCLTFLLGACGTSSVEQNLSGNSLYEQGQYKAALAAYQAAQVADPDQPEFYFNAAAALIQVNELDQAIAALEQALKNADDDLAAQIYYNLGNIHFQKGEYLEAVEAYRETLLRHPNDADARHNLELALLKIVPPTPTALEQKVEPEEGQTDPEATPTNNPSALDAPSPTPPPLPEGPPDEESPPIEGSTNVGNATIPSTPKPEEDGPTTVEDALRLLDSVKHDQETLREYLQEVATPGPSNVKDW